MQTRWLINWEWSKNVQHWLVVIKHRIYVFCKSIILQDKKPNGFYTKESCTLPANLASVKPQAA